MLFYLSKVIYWFLMPISWILILIVMAYFTKNHKLKQKLILSGFCLTLLLSNPWFANKAMNYYEYPLSNIDTIPKREYAVILTGVTQRIYSEDHRTFYSKGADRVLHTIELYRRGKVNKILVSGGSGAFNQKKSEPRECELVQHTLLAFGVKPKDILLEDQSRNTYENAQFTANLLNDKGVTEPVVLVTSAFHLPRAIACFKKAGIEVEPVAVDFYSNHVDASITDFIPREGALANWGILIHEIIGRVSYSILGYT